MYTNFDYLKQDPQFNSFSDVAISAEKIYIDTMLIAARWTEGKDWINAGVM